MYIDYSKAGNKNRNLVKLIAKLVRRVEVLEHELEQQLSLLEKIKAKKLG